ncbi:MAG: hypothetical protein ABI614_14605 [Planctomycetota bacterium]
MSRIVETESPDGTSASADMVGTWFNTNRDAPEIAKVVVVQEDDNLLIRVYALDDGRTVDWGEARAIPHASPGQPDEVTGFEACFEVGGIERRLAANLKLGVLVIQCYNRIYQSERGGYFTREFFHQRSEGTSDAPRAPLENSTDGSALPYVKAGDRLVPGATPLTAIVDLEPHFGTWRNTNRHTRSASHLELLRDSVGYLVHGFGIDAPQDWGAVRAIAFSDDVSSPRAAGFFADYDFKFMELRWAANFNKGLLIVAAFNRFNDDSGRSNYFTREFFYHERRSA